MNDFGELAAYLEAFQTEDGLGATPASSQPTTWFSLTKALEARATKKDLKLADVSGNQVVALGSPRTVGGKSLIAGDQFFWSPVTKQRFAVKTLKQLQAAQAKKSAPAPAPKAPANATYPTAKLQELLRAVGSPASGRLKDGKWGPTTKGEWERAARALGTDPASSAKPGARSAMVKTAAYNALEQRARAVTLGVAPPLYGSAASKPAPKTTAARPASKPASKPAPKTSTARPTEQSKGAMVRANVGQIQGILTKLGVKLDRDGMFGPKTASAWKATAARRKLDPAIDRAAPNEAWVMPATLAALSTAAASAKKPAAPKPAVKKASAKSARPTDPSKSGMSKVNVGQVQDILRSLGSTIKRDGLFGPNTRAAWRDAATRRKLDPALDRAGPIEAWVVPATFAALSGQAGDKKAVATKDVPISAKPAAKEPSPGGGALVSRLVPISQAELRDVLQGFKVQSKSGAELPNVWAALAKSRKLDGTSQVSKLGLEVVPKTKDALVKEGTLRLNVRKLVGNSTSSVPVKQVQQALRFANQVEPYKGSFSKVKATGLWDTVTETAFLQLTKVSSGNLPMWERALKHHLVSKDKKTVKMPELFANSVKDFAGKFKLQKKAVEAKEAAQKKAAEKAQEVDAYLATRVAGATMQLPVSTLQQALSEVRERQKAGIVPGPLLPGIKLTGVWDASTDKALYESFSNDLWGKRNVPAKQWKRLVNRLLLKKASKGLSGLYGMFGDLAAAPTGANYIRLPPAVATTAQQLSQAFVARTKKTGVMRESDEQPVPVAPAPVRAIEQPAYITGRVPQPQPVTGEQIQVPSIQTADGGQVDMPVGPAPIVPLPEPAPMPAQFAPEPEPIAPAPLPEPAPMPEPEPEPFVPAAEPAPEPEKKGGGNWGAAILASIGAALLLFQGEKEHRAEKRVREKRSSRVVR